MKSAMPMTANKQPQMGAAVFDRVIGGCCGYPFALNRRNAPHGNQWDRGYAFEFNPGEGAA